METVLREHRKAARITLRALAAETGLACSRLSRMENRQEKIWRGDIERLCKALPTLEGVALAGDDKLAL